MGDVRLYVCPSCAAILGETPQNSDCPFCRAVFIPCRGHSHRDGTPYTCYENDPDRLPRWLEDWDLSYDIDDDQRARLTEGAMAALAQNSWDVPVDALYTCLGRARAFVHLTSWGISPEIVGALKLIAATGVHVRGIVSAAREFTMKDHLRHPYEGAYNLELALLSNASPSDGGRPHLKLVIIDGVLAFTGSGNLTMTAWRNAAVGNEIIGVEADRAVVGRLNNRYFARAWARFGRQTWRPWSPGTRVHSMCAP